MQTNLTVDNLLEPQRSQFAVERVKPFLRENKFKKTVNVLIDNLRWINSLMNNAEEHLKEFVVNTEESNDYNMTKVPNFNLNKFKADIRCGRISETAKSILKKEPSKRVEEETRQLCNLVSWEVYILLLFIIQ